jgi:putative flippase GtrA
VGHWFGRRRRQLLFVGIGASCFLAQYGILTALSKAGVDRTLANALGFVLSAQLNFALSARLTWGDRPGTLARALWTRLASYNGTALIALGVNTLAFTLAYQRLGSLPAAGLGVVSGMCVTYLVCDRLIFRTRPAAAHASGSASARQARRVPGAPAALNLGRPVMTGVTPQVRQAASEPGLWNQLPPAPGTTPVDGVTIVMPAYGEEENLRATVTDFLQAPAAAGVPHCVVVVNDGSPDRTGEVAEQLAGEHPGRMLVTHHEVNRGYGAAVSTGIATALGQTDHRWLFLTDSDGQFKARQLPTFLAVARRERADAVVGFRPSRADPLYRRINASLWTAASRLLLRVGIRDVDCSYKLIDRRSLDGITLKGEAATISPELIAKLRLREARIVEHPVDHFPREHGEQTGAKLSVILRSLLGLLALSAEVMAQRAPGRVLRRLLHPKDALLAATTLAAAGASVASYLYFVHRNMTLDYPDAVSHLLIARRVIDASTAGAAQLGAVWLPLPHLLSLPFIWVSTWYYSGFAGSVISMAAYVLAVRYIYLTVTGLTRNRIGGLVAAIAFGANPNVLYLQSTPMTELLLIACIAATAYYLLRWCQTGHYMHLAATAAAALLATLTRYEGWVLCVAVAVIVAYVSWRRAGGGTPDSADGSRWRRWRAGLRASEANLIFFCCLAMSGIVGWVLWNAVIFSDPLYFQTGQFAKPSLWTSHADKAIGHWGVSVMTYLYAMADNVGYAALALGAVGFIFYLARTRLRIDSIAPLVLTVFLPFFVYALYSGQRPLHVRQITGDLYNVRFALLMTIPIAVFIGFLVAAIPRSWQAWQRRASQAALVLAVVACSALVARGGVVTLSEAMNFRAAPAQKANAVAAQWLRTHYNGGRVLMESFGNETVAFSSQIPSSQIIYEGSFRQWGADLAHPAGHEIRWIYMRRSPGSQDEVFLRLHSSTELAGYRLVYSDPDRLIYERRSSANQLTREQRSSAGQSHLGELTPARPVPARRVPAHPAPAPPVAAHPAAA